MLQVSKEEYDTCRITNPNPRIIAICDKPYKLMYFTITFRSFTPQPGGLEFQPGMDYYFICEYYYRLFYFLSSSTRHGVLLSLSVSITIVYLSLSCPATIARAGYLIRRDNSPNQNQAWSITLSVSITIVYLSSSCPTTIARAGYLIATAKTWAFANFSYDKYRTAARCVPNLELILACDRSRLYRRAWPLLVRRSLPRLVADGLNEAIRKAGNNKSKPHLCKLSALNAVPYSGKGTNTELRIVTRDYICNLVFRYQRYRHLTPPHHLHAVSYHYPNCAASAPAWALLFLMWGVTCSRNTPSGPACGAKRSETSPSPPIHAVSYHYPNCAASAPAWALLFLMWGVTCSRNTPSEIPLAARSVTETSPLPPTYMLCPITILTVLQVLLRGRCYF
ncbi:Ephrin-B2a [Homalodisca vitripennis]|nr:Ephrin-B2a [Homalodisca vitripennis]